MSNTKENPMSNMSYCKFRNTLADLKDCAESLHDTLDGDEARARVALVVLCRRITEELEGVALATLGSVSRCEDCGDEIPAEEVAAYRQEGGQGSERPRVCDDCADAA